MTVACSKASFAASARIYIIARATWSNGSSTRSSNVGVSRPDTTNSRQTIWRSSSLHQSEFGCVLISPRPNSAASRRRRSRSSMSEPHSGSAIPSRRAARVKRNGIGRHVLLRRDQRAGPVRAQQRLEKSRRKVPHDRHADAVSADVVRVIVALGKTVSRRSAP